MVDVKINDLTATVTPTDSQQLETDIGGIQSNKLTLLQLKGYVLLGTAALATALATPRNINGVAFNGTADINVPAAAGTLTGTALPASIVTSSLTALGTITSGSWHGGVIDGAYGGTGVANTGKSITLGGNLITAGAFNTTLTATATTTLTLPTTGTLATLAGAEALTNKTIASSAIDGTVTVQGYRPPVAVATTTYTLLLSDAGKHVALTNASAQAVTIPPNSAVAFPVGTELEFSQRGAGQVSFVAGVGVSIRSYQGNLKLAGQYAGSSLKKIATDEWLLVGQLVA